MATASSIVDLLQRHRVPYAVMRHAHSASSKETAVAAHVSPASIAKAVVLADAHGYIVAVVPANRYVEIDTLSRTLGRQLKLAPEGILSQLFGDCEPGAVPPFGEIYHLDTVIDDVLLTEPEIFFEAGDHEELICVDGEEFARLMGRARHGVISH